MSLTSRSAVAVRPIEPTTERIRKAGAQYEPPKVDTKTERRYGRVKSIWRALDSYLDDTEVKAGERLEHHIIGSVYRGHAYGSGQYLDEEEGRTEFAVTRHNQECALAKAEIGALAFQAFEEMIMAQFDENGHLAMKPEHIGRRWLGCRQRGQAHIAGIAYIKLHLQRLARMWELQQSTRRRQPPP